MPQPQQNKQPKIASFFQKETTEQKRARERREEDETRVRRRKAEDALVQQLQRLQEEKEKEQARASEQAAVNDPFQDASVEDPTGIELDADQLKDIDKIIDLTQTSNIERFF